MTFLEHSDIPPTIVSILHITKLSPYYDVEHEYWLVMHLTQVGNTLCCVNLDKERNFSLCSFS